MPTDIHRSVGTTATDLNTGGVTVEVVEENIYKSYYEWRVPIRTDFEPPNRFEFTEAIVDVIIELGENENLNVWFVPADAA